jgi:alpha-galactosidase
MSKDKLKLKKTIIFFLFISILLFSFGYTKDKIDILGYKIDIIGKTGNFKIKYKVKKIEKNLEILTITLLSEKPETPPKFSLKWSLSSHNIAGFWSVNSWMGKIVNADWYPSKVDSMFAKNAPVFTLFGYNNKNRLSVAVSDALNSINLSAGIREEDGRIYCGVEFFKEKYKKTKEYKVEIRFDKRNIPFYKALSEIPNWWASFDGYKPSNPPTVAKLPMYSTWYGYHQKISSKILLKEVKIAKTMGFETIIIDDGWQTRDNNRGYAYTGDWKPEKISDMKKFVDEIHKIGMKIILWYAVPFMGEKAENFKRFKGKYLRYWSGQGAYILDPRYPEVREYIINIYKRAIKEWNLDGFKLDFMERFSADKNTVLEKKEGRDFASVNEAADKLMTDIIKELKKIKPDIMIEFRQPYIGPLMRKYGNMFRVGDCPNSAVSNRVGIVDLRLMSGNTAVHSDMLMWNYGEKVEIAALQFWNIIFGVPQLSVRLEDIPEEHFKMVKFLTKYWIQNREILLNGVFEPSSPLSNYSIISAEKDDKKIMALYDSMFITLNYENKLQKMDIINAKTTKDIILNIKCNLGKFRYKIYNCKGEIIKKGIINLTTGIYKIKVPVSGIISLKLL